MSEDGGVFSSDSNDMDAHADTYVDRPFHSTRRAALGMTVAATAGFLADKALLSPEAADAAEGATSITAQVVVTVNVTTTGIPSKYQTDEVTLVEGQIVLLTQQTTASENGLWTVKGGATKWTRPTSFAAASEQYGVLVPIVTGEAHAGSVWLLKNTSKVVVGTTAQEWEETSAIKGTPFVFGINGNNNDYSTWVPANVLGDRGGNLNETTSGLALKYNATATERKNLVTSVGERLERGLVCDVQIDVTKLSEVTAAAYATAYVAIVKEVLVAHPTTSRVVFEITNEPYDKTSEGASNKKYAEMCSSTYKAVEEALSKKELGEVTTMPTLLVAAWGRYSYVEGGKEIWSNPEEGRGWLRDFFTAWPEGKKKVNGFYSHPYNNPTRGPLSVISKGWETGYRAVASEHQIAVEEGCTGANNFWVTEFGWTRSELPGGTEKEKETEVAEKLQEALEISWQYYAEGWLRASLIYANNEVEGKGIYGTAAQSVLTSFARAHRAPLLNLAIGAWPPAGVFDGPVQTTVGTAFNTEYVANATRLTTVNVTIELNPGSLAGENAIAEPTLKNPEGSEGTLTIGREKQPAKSETAVERFLTFDVPPGWKWQIKGERGKINGAIYQVR